MLQRNTSQREGAVVDLGYCPHLSSNPLLAHHATAWNKRVGGAVEGSLIPSLMVFVSPLFIPQLNQSHPKPETLTGAADLISQQGECMHQLFKHLNLGSPCNIHIHPTLHQRGGLG